MLRIISFTAHSRQWSMVNIEHIYGEPYLSTEVTSSIGELSFRSLEQSATQYGMKLSNRPLQRFQY